MDRKRITEGSLASRLKFLRENRSGGQRIKNIPQRKGEAFVQRTFLQDGWTKEGEYLYTREVATPLRGGFVSRILPASLLFLRDREVPLEDLLFYDLETTGLSTGAGVMAFLGGLGRVTGDLLVVKQFFLADFPGEFEFVEALIKEFKPGKVLVSYNGKAFDRNLLVSRALLMGLHIPEYSDLPEIDLLYPSRRLWKAHLPDCRLKTIEKGVLGIVRHGDIPGRDIPDIYFKFLKDGSTVLMNRVFYHHLQDIQSLVFLMGHIVDLLENPLKCVGEECFSLGRYMIGEQTKAYRKQGEELLGKIWQEGGRFSLKAGAVLSLYCKRELMMDGAVKIWEKMWEREKSYFQGVELAKFYEHKLNNYKKACYYTKTLISEAGESLSSSEREKLFHRLSRLERKISKSEPCR